MSIFTDQINHSIELNSIPERIISVVPSQTELLYYLGLENNIVAQTIFCVHPKEKFKQAVKIGGTKKLQIEKIKQLNPHLIIANKEENEKTQIEELQKHFPVWTSDIYAIKDAINMITEIGKMTNTTENANKLSQEIVQNMATIKNKKTCLYLCWNNPLMAVGQNTFIQSMLVCAGFINCLTDKELRYPIITEQEIIKLQPQYILLSTEPFPFTKKHVVEFQKKFPFATITLVDGEMFSWYGSRLLKSFDYFKSLRI